MMKTVRFIYTKYWGILYVEHYEKIYLQKTLRNTLCWILWEDLFTQNTEEYCMVSTVGRFIYIKYWGILYVENCEKIYLHKILRNSECWSLWEDILTQNTEEYWINLPTVFNVQYSSVFCVNKSSHSVQHKVFLSIFCK
jgi:hypothetical protein